MLGASFSDAIDIRHDCRHLLLSHYIQLGNTIGFDTCFIAPLQCSVH